MSTRCDAKALRALLTDECDCEEGIDPDTWGISELETRPHERCGGRGWILKDGVSEGWQWTTEGKREPSGDLIIPLDCLDAEDE